MNTKNVLVALPPGKIQEGLQVMLAALLHVRTMVTGDGAAALQTVRAYPFDMVIVDGDFLEDETLVSALREGTARSLALADCSREIDPLLEAGIDEVRLKGYPAHQLLALIKILLEDKENE